MMNNEVFYIKPLIAQNQRGVGGADEMGGGIMVLECQGKLE